MKIFCLALFSVTSTPVMAAIQCGNYVMTGDGMTVINGETVTSQNDAGRDKYKRKCAIITAHRIFTI
jgi:hypothetical protein